MVRRIFTAAAVVLLTLAAGRALAQETVPIQPGDTTVVELSPNVVVANCDDGQPHSGPTASDFYIRPEGAAEQLEQTPSSAAIRAGGASVPIRIPDDARPGSVIIVGWTAVADGCYSANGSVTFEVSLDAPPASSDGGVVAGGAAPIEDDGGSRAAGDLVLWLMSLAAVGAAVVGAKKLYDGSQQKAPRAEVQTVVGPIATSISTAGAQIIGTNLPAGAGYAASAMSTGAYMTTILNEARHVALHEAETRLRLEVPLHATEPAVMNELDGIYHGDDNTLKVKVAQYLNHCQDTGQPVTAENLQLIRQLRQEGQL